MLDSAMLDALARRPPIWAAGAQDWWDFTRSGRAKRGVGAMPVETRASDGWVENEAGVWVLRSPNTRSMAGKGLLTYPGRTNQIKNPSAAGAVSGVVGSGGALPTGWAVGGTNYSSVTRTVTPMTRNGLSGVAIRYQIVATSGSQSVFDRFGLTSDVALAASTAYSMSFFTEVIAGDATGIRMYFNLPQYDVSSVLTGEVFATAIAVPTGWSRYNWLWTSPASTVKAEPRVRFDAIAAGTYDFTVFIAWPQIEAGTFAGPPIADASATTTDTSAGPQQVIDIGSRAAGGVGGIARVNLQAVDANIKMLLRFSDGSGSNTISLFQTTGPTARMTIDAAAGGGLQANLGLGTIAAGVIVVAFAVWTNYAMAEVIGNAAPSADTSVVYPALDRWAPGGAGYNVTDNSYLFTEKVALWYGPMSQHFYDNVIRPKGLLLKQAA